MNVTGRGVGLIRHSSGGISISAMIELRLCVLLMVVRVCALCYSMGGCILTLLWAGLTLTLTLGEASTDPITHSTPLTTNSYNYNT